MKKFSLYIMIGLFVIISQGIRGQQVFDARSAGMAFSNAADTRGLEQVGLNPATLALHNRFNFELNLLSVNVAAYNNSFNKGLYDRYFTSGDSLSSNDKSNILNAIPGSGLRGNVDARINSFAVYMPRFSLSLTGVGSGTLNLPRELAELTFNGNDDLGRVYDFSNIEGVGWGGAAVTAAAAFPLSILQNNFIDFAAVGMAVKYITGLGYFEITESQGSFYNTGFDQPSVRLDGLIKARVAQGGAGYGYDLGFIAQSEDRLTLSLALLNTVGSIKWNRDTKLMYYSIETDSLAISSDGIDDSLIVDKDSTQAVGSFSTRLPLVLDMGVSYRFNKRLIMSAEYEQGLTSSMGAITTPRLALGMEFTGIPLLPVRTGVSLGGKNEFSLAFGMGLNFHYWYLDVGVMNHGGILSGSSKGLTVAATTRLRF